MLGTTKMTPVTVLGNDRNLSQTISMSMTKESPQVVHSDVGVSQRMLEEATAERDRVSEVQDRDKMVCLK